MERGWKEFNAFLERRQNLKYPVHWEVHRNTLSFGKPFQEIRDAFGLIEEGSLAKSVERMATHEQVNVLQAIMYNDEWMAWALAGNQFAWATGFPTGDYAEIQLTLSAQCRAKSTLTAYFSRNWNAKLWIVSERMDFVNRAARRFDKLLNSPARPQIEESLRIIYAGGGVM